MAKLGSILLHCCFDDSNLTCIHSGRQERMTARVTPHYITSTCYTSREQPITNNTWDTFINHKGLHSWLEGSWLECQFISANAREGI